ncbi:CIC11C00000001634 [Sungouiella intermedia]|uniref:CIC11C00000001634 n=1 Tax=Sungouiella intermedia TaxID=45354 RepID=A0A1L0DEF1_9ASCO|nr:CIC11C00000001634 [[Candida] intermedia]
MAAAYPLAGGSTRDIQPLDPDSLNLDDFKSLHVSTPIESTKFAFISMLLSRVLNLKSDTLLLECSTTEPPALLRNKPSPELLPQIAMPPDLWLIPELVIRNAVLKAAILREVNTLLLLYIESLQTNELFLLDDALIASLEKRIADSNLAVFAYKHEPEPLFDSLHEVEEFEENDTTEEYSVFLRRSVSGNHELMMSKASSRPMSTTSSKNLHRLSSFSREFVANKRKFSSFLGQHTLSEEDRLTLLPTTPLQNLPVLNPLPQLPTPTPHKDGSGAQALANGLFKSRIYSKIKKRRELANSVVSTTTSLSSINSSPSLRRKSNAGNAFEADFTTPGKTSPPLNEMQRIENQRRKHEYYLQTKMFGELSNVLTGFLGKSGLRANLMPLMDFIKNSVFRFILVDICQMIVDYGHFKLLYGSWRDAK